MLCVDSHRSSHCAATEPRAISSPCSPGLGGLLGNPGAPIPPRHLHLRRDKCLQLGGVGAADRCSRERTAGPPGITSPFRATFLPRETGGGSVCRFPRAIRVSEALPFVSGRGGMGGAGCGLPPRPDRTTARGPEAGPPPHSPAARGAPPGRARDPSGSAPPSPAPQPGPPPLGRRSDLKSPPRAGAAGDANRPAVPSPRRRGRGRRDRGAGAHAQWTRPRPSPSAPEVCRDPNSESREAAGPVKALIGVWAGPRKGWAGPQGKCPPLSAPDLAQGIGPRAVMANL